MTLLDEITDQIKARIDELAPSVEEHARLAEALSRMNGATPPKAANGNGSHRGRGRPRGSGQTIDRILAIVTREPGLTIPEIGPKIGLDQPNYLYRALPNLEQIGKVRCVERRWYPAA